MYDISQPKYIYPNFIKLFIVFLGCLGFSGLGFAFLLVGDLSIAVKIIGIVCILFFGIIGGSISVRFLLSSILRRPIITLSEAGFINKTALLSPSRLVSWDEVTASRIVSVNVESNGRYGKTTTKNKFVALTLADPLNYKRGLTTGQHWFASANADMMKSSEINIGLSFANVKAEELLDYITAYSRGKVKPITHETLDLNAKIVGGASVNVDPSSSALSDSRDESN